MTRRRAEDFEKRTGPLDMARLHLKVRVVLTRRMRASEAEALMHEAITSGEVPDGIELRWIDWAKGTTGRARSGRISQDVQEGLEVFYGAITSATTTRFAPVKRTGKRGR